MNTHRFNEAHVCSFRALTYIIHFLKHTLTWALKEGYFDYIYDIDLILICIAHTRWYGLVCTARIKWFINYWIILNIFLLLVGAPRMRKKMILGFSIHPKEDRLNRTHAFIYGEKIWFTSYYTWTYFKILFPYTCLSYAIVFIPTVNIYSS